MSSRQCPQCGRRYPSSYQKCPYCSGEGRSRRNRPADPLSRIVAVFQQNGSRIFLGTCTLFLCIACLGAILTRCSEGKTPEQDAPAIQAPVLPPPEPLSLSQAAATVTAGETVTLHISGGFDTLIWTTSDAAVATVNNGVVTGVAAGSATVTASTGVESVSCEVTVEEPAAPVSQFELALNHTDFTIRAGGDPVQMKVRIKGTRDIYEGEVVWTSQDVNVATISDTGLVERAGRGTTTITAYADGQILECIVRAPR